MLDEYAVIDLITKRFGKLPRGYTQIGDDVATMPSGRKGESLILKSDTLVGRTDVPPGMSWEMAARKAVAMCVSDFAAKGVRPVAFMISLGMPAGTPEGMVEEVADGLHRASREWRLKLVGGDVSVTDDLVVGCAMVGFARRIVKRDGARPGELVVTTGPFGQTSAGLKIITGGAKAAPRFRKAAVSSVLRPDPDLELGIAISGLLSSSIDSSDGLAISLHTLSEASGVGVRLTDIPFAAGLREFAARNAMSAEELSLYGGEEYVVVGTIGRERLQAAKRKAGSLGRDLHVIGDTMPQKVLSGVAFADGRKVRKDGWVKFRSEPAGRP